MKSLLKLAESPRIYGLGEFKTKLGSRWFPVGASFQVPFHSTWVKVSRRSLQACVSQWCAEFRAVQLEATYDASGHVVRVRVVAEHKLSATAQTALQL